MTRSKHSSLILIFFCFPVSASVYVKIGWALWYETVPSCLTYFACVRLTLPSRKSPIVANWAKAALIFLSKSLISAPFRIKYIKYEPDYRAKKEGSKAYFAFLPETPVTESNHTHFRPTLEAAIDKDP